MQLVDKTTVSLQWPPPVSPCVLTIMVMLSVPLPSSDALPGGTEMTPHRCDFFGLQWMSSKRDFFLMSHFLFGWRDGCGLGNEEWFRGANVLVCESELV